MEPINIGKMRNLQSCATNEGIFTILAADHRDALKALLHPGAPEMTSTGEMVDLKLAICSTLAPVATAVLLDPIFSAPQAIATGKIPNGIGLLVGLEEQGYLGDPFNRHTTLIDGWSVEKVNRMGANGVKMLLFYHPHAGSATKKQEILVRSIVAECQKYQIPFFLEPISYSLWSEIKKDSAEFAILRPQMIIDAAQRLSETGIDILKIEFPVTAKFEQDRGVWSKACKTLNDVCRVPWVLLSAGEPYDIFKEQVRIACDQGCSGFVVGRAVWQEAVNLEGQERMEFLKNVALPRLSELSQIAKEHGSAWFSRYPTSPVDEEWYKTF